MAEEVKRTPLPEGFKLKKKEEPERTPLPEGFKLKPKQSRPEEVRDVVGEELAAAGIEDENELERAAELGTAEGMRGLISGATFGLSKHVPGLKPGENPAATTGEVIGSFVPLSKLINVFEGPVMKLAAKSPVLQKQLGSLATMFGVGATAKGLETVAKGEIPSVDELLEHGIEWAALDAVLQTAGVGGRFVKGLFSRSKQTGVPRKDILNRTIKELEESGVDMTDAEAVSAKALEILEGPVTQAEQAAGIQLAKQEQTKAAEVAKESLKPKTSNLEAGEKVVTDKGYHKGQEGTIIENKDGILTVQYDNGTYSGPISNFIQLENVPQKQQITPKDLKTRKITDEPVNRLTKESVALAEPYQPEKMDFRKDAEELEKSFVQVEIESAGPRAATEEELGTNIKEDIETQLKERKDEYRPLYKEAQEASEAMTHSPKQAAKEAGDKLLSMSRLKTKPSGYEAVLTTLENVLSDAGFVIQREGGKSKGPIEKIISGKEVPVSDTIELARRLNEIVDYEAIEPTVKDALKSVVRAAKRDIREGLAANPDALTAFELAEQAHAETASRFSKDSIRKVRGQGASEKIGKMIESPSMLGDLREVLSPEQMMQVEREVLEKLNNQTFEKAQKQLREVEKHLSAENKKLAREIVEAKNPHNPAAKKKLTQDAIITDMSNAFTNGARPSKTLELWKTTKGQKLVKESFHNSPNWPEVKNYLEKQSFNDMVASVTKDGKIDLKKFNSFMRDPAVVNTIRAQGGEEAVTFFKSIDSQVKQMEQNLKMLEKLPTKEQIERGRKFLKESQGQRKLEQGVAKNKRIERETAKLGQESIETQQAIRKETTGERGSQILKRMVEKDFPIQAKTKKWREWFTDTMGLNEKGLLSVFGLMKLGLPNTVISLISYRLFNKLLTSPRLRRAFTEAAKQRSNPLSFILAIENLGKQMSEKD